MNYRNAAVVSLLASVMVGCAHLPTGHSSRSIHNRSTSQIEANKSAQLFTSDEKAGTTIAETDSTPPPVSGLQIRKSKRGNMDSYVVRGQRYHTLDSSDGYSARGLASWYGPNFHGRTASNGEVYDMYKMTAAHKTLPLPTFARVTHIDNGKAIIVKINDRGPFSGDRLIDLSFAAALELGMVNDGTAMVEIQALSPEELVVLSGPANTLGVDFYYDAGPEKNPSLPVSELFVADSALVRDEVKGSTVQPVASVDPQLIDQNVVSLDSLKVADASVAVPVDGSVVDLAAIDTKIDTTYLEVVVPGRQNAAANAKALQTAERELLADESKTMEVATADVLNNTIETKTGSTPQPQRVPVSLIGNAGLGQTLPATVVPAMMTAKQPLPVSNDRYYIQAGVFADVGDAEKVAVDIVLEIPSEEVHVKPLKDSHMYRITVGPIISDEHAQEVSGKLNTIGIENYTVKVKEI